MKRASRVWPARLLSVTGVAGALVAGCGSDPEMVGDACDIDDGADACPSGLVCDRRGDEDICLYPPGAPCDPALEQDYCQGGSCVDDGDGGHLCAREIEEGGTCDPNTLDFERCVDGTVCAELEAGGFACHPPVFLRGQVFDSETEAAIAGAEVIGLDDQATAVTDVAVSDATGSFELEVPVPRDASGAPVMDAIFTLRASAADYLTFPGPIRTALPIASSEAASSEAGWVIESALTDIALIGLPEDERGLPTISGHVLAGELSAGVLVVAEGAQGLSAVSDKTGRYTIFNVPDGNYDVRGYAANVQLAPESVAMAGADLADVDLTESAAGLGTVEGSVNIVNAPGGSATSVVLVVASTFSDTFVRGEVPRGLRSPLSGPPNVNGSFTISGVPEGSYVVLAAFENDGLVRDPDPNIAGTQIVTIAMPTPGKTVSLESFKITEALAVVSPGASDPEPVSQAPTLTWADDSSEDFYTVVVFNAFGELVWCRSDLMMGCDGGNVPNVNGSNDVEVSYDGPLTPGMYYQFRATSWRQSGNSEPGPIAQTEDLRGVFFVPGG